MAIKDKRLFFLSVLVAVAIVLSVLAINLSLSSPKVATSGKSISQACVDILTSARTQVNNAQNVKATREAIVKNGCFLESKLGITKAQAGSVCDVADELMHQGIMCGAFYTCTYFGCYKNTCGYMYFSGVNLSEWNNCGGGGGGGEAQLQQNG